MRIVYLPIFLLFSFCGCENLCSDGHSPLIDGEEAFLCSRQCPDGFQCENVTGLPAEVCCPNLRQLYKIYGDEQNATVSENETKNENRRVEAKDQPATSDFVEVKAKSELVLDEKSGIKYSCERQNYEILCKNGTLGTQATIRWFRNGEHCEYYPWGYCPGDLVIHSTTIRTKRACEELCFERKEQKENITTIPPLETTATIQPTTLQFPLVINADSATENLANLTDIIVDSVVEKSLDANDVAEYEEKEEEKEDEKENPTEIRLRFSKNVQGIENTNDFGEFSVDKVGITIEDQDKEKKKPSITCQLVPLRTMCDSGMAAQFTWRWILNETTKECTTTPFGYCSREMNVNLPRTQEECQRACLKG